MNEDKDMIQGRRDFLRKLGLGAAGLAGLSLAGCRPEATGNSGSAPAPGEGEMTYRTNPKTGDKVSLLGFGMMRLPNLEKGKTSEESADIDQDEVNLLVDYALAHGVNYFDTSPAYCRGFSERATGIALSRHPRESYFIATKLSNFAPQTWSREESIAMFRNSLKELQTDYVDYLLLHAIGMGEDGMEEFNNRYIKNGILDFLLEEREAGRIRNLGFSYHGDVAVFDHALACHDKYKWDFVQIQLNYLDWKYAKQINPSNTDAEYLYNELESRGIPAVIMEPLLGGRLSNVPDDVVRMLKEREPEASVASWAFRFAGSKPGVMCVLSGMNRMEHLQENVRNYSPLKVLTDEEFAFLQRTADRMMQFDTIPCNDCKYCMPCPYGLDIPAVLLHYNKCINEGNVTAGPSDPNYARARRAFLVGYDRSVPRLRQASHCIGCGQCAPHCPQGINIPAQMQRIDEYVEKLKRN